MLTRNKNALQVAQVTKKLTTTKKLYINKKN
jgi:hypothetical protein